MLHKSLGIQIFINKIENTIIIKMDIKDIIIDEHYNLLYEIKNEITKLISVYGVNEKKDDILDRKIIYSELLYNSAKSFVGNIKLLPLYYETNYLKKKLLI